MVRSMGKIMGAVRALLIWAAGLALTVAGATAAAQAPSAQSFTPEQVATGAQTYERFCAPCHGTRMEDTETAFNLRNFPRDEKQRFVESVTKGKNSMPPWGGLLTPEQIEALWAYVLSRQAELSAAASAAPPDTPAAPSAQAWPCGGDPKLLVDGAGAPVWISSDELISHGISMPLPALPAATTPAGKLAVDVLVDSQGRVKCSRAAQGQPAVLPGLMESVTKWVFRPFSAGGQPVAVYGHLQITLDSK